MIESVETIQDTCSKYAKLHENASLHESCASQKSSQEVFVELHLQFNSFRGKCDRLVATLEKFGANRIRYVAKDEFNTLKDCADKISLDQSYFRTRLTDHNLWTQMNQQPSLEYASLVDDGANRLIGTLNEIAATLHH